MPNSAHSIFIWQDGGKAYAVIVDNTELADSTSSTSRTRAQPVPIADLDLFELADDQGIDVVDTAANGDNVFMHDMVVKRIDGMPTMLVSYWDAGYVKLDVSTRPTRPIIGDSAFDDEDPLSSPRHRRWSPPEGNAHQAEFCHDNKFMLAADEDFDHVPLRSAQVDHGQDGRPSSPAPAAATSGPRRAAERDRSWTGDTRYIGDGCTPANIPAATGASRSRSSSACQLRLPGKTENAEAKGYTGVVIFDAATRRTPPCDGAAST